MTININGIVVIDADRRIMNHRLVANAISSNTTATAGQYYVANAVVTLTLPASPTVGDQVGFNNQTTSITSVINNNGLKINGTAEALTVDVAYASMTLVYTGTDRGWVIT